MERHKSKERKDLSRGKSPQSSTSESDDSIQEKHKKSSKHRRHSSGSLQHKRKHSKRPKRVPTEEISAEDYYRRSSEYRRWLLERGMKFGKLSSEQSRKYFLKFVKKWNKGRLSEDYYGELQTSAHATVSGSHARMTPTSDLKLQGDGPNPIIAREEGSPTSRKRPVIGPMMPPGSHCVSSDSEEDRSTVKLKRKRFREDDKLVLDELLPKATGHDAKVEKRKLLAEKRTEREESPEVRDSFLMGPSQRGGIQKRIEGIRSRREKKSKAAQEKLMDYQAKEAAKAQAIMELARASKKEGALWK